MCESNTSFDEWKFLSIYLFSLTIDKTQKLNYDNKNVVSNTVGG